jgi:hypothetical protein
VSFLPLLADCIRRGGGRTLLGILTFTQDLWQYNFVEELITASKKSSLRIMKELEQKEETFFWEKNIIHI